MNTFIENNVALSFFAILFCVVGALIAYYGKMVATIVKWSQKPVRSKNNPHKGIRMREISFKKKWKCYIPLYQCCIAQKTLWGGYGPWLVISIVAAVLVIVRLVNALVIGISPYVMFFTAIGMYLGMLLIIILYAVTTVRIALAYGFNWLIIVLSVVLPPIAAWYMSTHIPGVMKALYKEETFHEHLSDTVIERRTNK